MKRFFLFFIVIFTVAIMASCQTQTKTTKTTVKNTVKEIGTEGFLFKKVVRGDTVWGYSQETYGTGLRWRDVVKENPFLDEPGRVYYDQTRSKWIVIILPGEVIRIKGQFITPTFVSEETTTTTTTETEGIPWWGWLLVAVGSAIVLFFIFGIVGLFSFHRQCRPCCTPYCSEPSCFGRPMSIEYQSEANSGCFSLTSRGFGETTLSRNADGRTNLMVRR